jgi:hypothetical protein
MDGPPLLEGKWLGHMHDKHVERHVGRTEADKEVHRRGCEWEWVGRGPDDGGADER